MAATVSALRLLAAQGVIPVDGVGIEVLSPPAFACGGAGAKNEEDTPMVASNAVVAAHGQAQEGKHKDVVPLPSRGMNIDGIAESTFHWALVLWLGMRIE
jgi:hypothetical protein